VICVVSLGTVALMIQRDGLTGVGIGLLVGQLAGAALTLPAFGSALRPTHTSPRQPTEYSSNHKTIAVILDEQLSILSGQATILDIGCGSGSITDLIRQAAPEQVRLIGADIDLNALRVANKEYPGNCFIQYNGYDLPLPQSSIDYVVAQEVIEHVPDGKRFMDAIAGVLKPGGFCLITTPNAERQPLIASSHPDHVKHYRRDELAALAAEHGLETADVFYRYHLSSALFDSILLAVGRRVLPTYEVQAHMTIVDNPNQHLLLGIYDRWIDPLITIVEQLEFKLLRRIPAPAQVCILHKPAKSLS